jgi:hypothetical protein
MTERTADTVATEFLLPTERERDAHAAAVQALLARNALLTVPEAGYDARACTDVSSSTDP